MGIRERLTQLRKKMDEHGMDMYFVPTNDFHGSEYVSDYFKTREFLSGFDGSAGNLLVTKEQAYLWTDGRYFLQAEEQLKDTGIVLYKSGQEGVPTLNQFVAANIPEEGTFGVDGRMVSGTWGEGMRKLLAEKKAKLVLTEDLAGDVWYDRPPLVHENAWILSEKYAGEGRISKLAKLRKFAAEHGGSNVVLTSLDEIAWLLNIRGNDIPHNPVVFSYLIVGEEKCWLFVGKNVFCAKDREVLEQDGIIILNYATGRRGPRRLPSAPR